MLAKTEEGDSLKYTGSYLTGGSLPFQLALKTTAQVGVCSLRIFGNVYRERFEILQLTEQLRRLEVGL